MPRRSRATWGRLRDKLLLRAALSVAGLLAISMLPAIAAPAVATTSAAAPPPVSAENVGLVDTGTGQWHLRLRDGSVSSFYYGNPGDIPFSGDWNCDGVDTPGLFRQSDAFVYLRNSNTRGIADIRFFFGNPDDVPLAGDFNGDGCDTVSIYRPSEQRFYIINELGENEGGLGAADIFFTFGNPGDTPVVGDWDGDGVDEAGLYRESTGFFYFRNTLDAGIATDRYFFGNPEDRFVAGDWTDGGSSTPAVYRPSAATFYFRHSLTEGIADAELPMGDPQWWPVGGVFQLTPKFRVDGSLAPWVRSIPFVDGTGSRPIASITDHHGNTIDFVENEAIIALDDPSALPGILARLNATVLDQLDSSGLGTSDGPTFYLLRVDAAQAVPGQLAGLVMGAGLNGADHRVSSQRGLNLLTALAAENQSMATQAGANYLMRHDGLAERATAESPNSIGGPSLGASYSPDAFQLPYMNRGSNQNIGAAEAARLIHEAVVLRRPGERVGLAIIDGGFSSTADFPDVVLVRGTAMDMRNTVPCSGGIPCPWHGTYVGSTAFSRFDDGVGGAGPASEVVRPILVQAPAPNVWDYGRFVFRTIPEALRRGPEIVNMSFSADIPAGLCLVGTCAVVNGFTSAFHDGGILLFASAGNDGVNVDDEDCFLGICWESNFRVPCEASHVICVGGLANDTWNRDPSSAWGREHTRHPDSIDIYAPYRVWVHDNPDSGTTSARYVGGTSYASPFTAAIAALIKAADPTLGPDGIWRIMEETANTAGPRWRWVNAYEAVRRALGGNGPPFARIRLPTDGQEFSWNAGSVTLGCDVDDDGGASALRVWWTSDRDGAIGAESPETSISALSLGTHRITCHASDGEYTVTDETSITVVNDPPRVSITHPRPGVEFFRSLPIQLIADASDINGDLASVTWRALRNGLAGPDTWTGSGEATFIPPSTLQPDRYQMEVTAMDSQGFQAVEWVTVRVLADPPDLPPVISDPTVTPIPASDPFDNPPSEFWAEPCPTDVNGSEPGNGECQRLVFGATVTDDNETPAELNYRWDVARDGVFLSPITTTTADLTLDLIPASYIVALVVTDRASPPNSANWSWPFIVRTLT